MKADVKVLDNKLERNVKVNINDMLVKGQLLE